MERLATGDQPLLSLLLPLRHPVADARFGDDVAGAVGVIPKLAAQPLHHFSDQPCLADPLLRPQRRAGWPGKAATGAPGAPDSPGYPSLTAPNYTKEESNDTRII